jgi:thymidylate kinase
MEVISTEVGEHRMSEQSQKDENEKKKKKKKNHHHSGYHRVAFDRDWDSSIFLIKEAA